MRFLIDQQLPVSLCRFFSERGCEAEHVKLLSLAQADDRTIWREALVRGAIIVSKDEDFSLIPRHADKPQVVWVRTGNCSNARLLAHFEVVWDTLRAELAAGARLVELRP